MVNQDCHFVSGTLTASTNEMLRIFESKRQQQDGENCIIGVLYNMNFSPNTCLSIRNFCRILFGWQCQRRWDRRCMNHWWERCIRSDGRDAQEVMGEMHTKSQPGNLRGRQHFNGLGEIKLEWLFFGKYIVRVWFDAFQGKGPTGRYCKIRNTRKWAFDFHKRRLIIWVEGEY